MIEPSPDINLHPDTPGGDPKSYQRQPHSSLQIKNLSSAELGLWIVASLLSFPPILMMINLISFVGAANPPTNRDVVTLAMLAAITLVAMAAAGFLRLSETSSAAATKHLLVLSYMAAVFSGFCTFLSPSWMVTATWLAVTLSGLSLSWNDRHLANMGFLLTGVAVASGIVAIVREREDWQGVLLAIIAAVLMFGLAVVIQRRRKLVSDKTTT